jgi:hypothetical protein
VQQKVSRAIAFTRLVREEGADARQFHGIQSVVADEEFSFAPAGLVVRPLGQPTACAVGCIPSPSELGLGFASSVISVAAPDRTDRDRATNPEILKRFKDSAQCLDSSQGAHISFFRPFGAV